MRANVTIKKKFGESYHAYPVILVCLALVVITLAVYLQAGNHEFLSFDDTQYVTRNPHVSSGINGKNIVWAFTSVDAFNWHPVTWLSHMADAQLYGLNPRGHHVTNVIIHIVSSLLLLLFLLRCTGSLWQSSFVAFLFALHPLHVESVAWVAERKDVLSALFWFLTLFFYSEYVAQQKTGLYLLALFSFIVGLMSKPMLVTLPLVMCLMDYWPLDRYRRDEQEQRPHHRAGKLLPILKEKIPFLACSLLSMIITLYAQNRGGAVIGLNVISFRLRTENALIAYVNYIIKTLWPSDLAVYYPFPPTISLWHVFGSLFVLLLISAASILARRRYPFFAVGWFWFLVTLVPVIGLVQVGRQSMADRYSYLPQTGLFIMAAWGVPLLINKMRYRKGILALLASTVIIASTALTWQQLGYWRDSISLYRHTLQVTSDNYLIHYNLGVDLAEKGDLDSAIQNYRAALRISPNYSEAHNNLGLALAQKGDLDVAIQEYQVTLRLSPNDVKVHYNLGNVLAQKGNLDAAIREYQIALQIDPGNADAHISLGNALAQKGSPEAAIREYRIATRINPDNFDSHNNLGVALANKGDLDSAIQEYRAALWIAPDNEDAHNNLGVALTKKGELDAAIQEFQIALQINPNNSGARNNLGIVLAKKKNLNDAIK